VFEGQYDIQEKPQGEALAVCGI